MREAFRRMAVLVCAAAVVASLPASVSHAWPGTTDPNNTPYVKTVESLGNGWGIVRITTTEASTDPLYDYRYVSGGAISSAKSIGGQPELYQVFGAQVGYGTNAGATDNDVTAFNFIFDPLAPDTLTIWRNWIFTSARPGGLTDLGLGGVSNDGTISIRVDGYGGGAPGSAIGTLNGTSTTPLPNKLFSYDSVPGQWHRMCGGTTCTAVVVPPGIGDTDNVQAYSSFANFLAACRATFTPSGSSCLNAHAVDISSGSHRGCVTVNSASKKMAVFAKVGGDASDQVSGIRYISYTCNPPYNAFASSSVVYNFSGTIPGKVCSGTNFFSSTPYRGPEQIALNDLGDAAFPVVIVDQGVVPGSWRTISERGILFMDSSGTFKVVCRNDNGSSAPLLFYDPITPFAPTFGGVAIDNERNVYFSYTNWMGVWGGGVKSTTMICKATPDNPANPTRWSVSPIVWLGQQWYDAQDAVTYRLAILPHYSGMTEYYNNPAAFSHKNLNRTPILGNSAGGFLISAGLGYDNPDAKGTRMSACYVQPTLDEPNASNIAQAKALADGEGVNLHNLVLISQGPDYTDLNGNIWAQYIVGDSTGTILIQSIRQGLKPGDLINVSGSVYTDSGSGEKLIHSTGLVLVDRKPYGVTNKTVADGGIILGKWVKVWGKVSNLDTVSKTFTLDDGSGTPLTVDYNQAGSALAVPANGQIVSVTGRAAAGAVVVMEYGADVI